MRTQLINEERQKKNNSVNTLLKLRDDHITKQLETQLNKNQTNSCILECGGEKTENKTTYFNDQNNVVSDDDNEYATKPFNVNESHKIKEADQTNKSKSSLSDGSSYEIILNSETVVDTESNDFFNQHMDSKHIEFDKNTCAGNFGQEIKTNFEIGETIVSDKIPDYHEKEENNLIHQNLASNFNEAIEIPCEKDIFYDCL